MGELTEKQAFVSRILTFSCVDGPGNRMVLFLQGCNFNCRNCHNPHTINHCNHCQDCVAGCPSQALQVSSDGKVVWEEALCSHCDQCTDVCSHNASPKIKRYRVSQVLATIRQHQAFLSGITVSGGEATTQLPFIIDLFRAVKEDSQLGHLTCFIDSNGYLPEKSWQRVLPWLDGAMIDLKAWQNETHRWLTGRDNHRVISAIRFLADAGKLYELRLLHIPQRSDLDLELDSIVRLIRSLPANVKIRLNAFQHHGVTGEALTWQACSKEDIQTLHQKLARQIDHYLPMPQTR